MRKIICFSFLLTQIMTVPAFSAPVQAPPVLSISGPALSAKPLDSSQLKALKRYQITLTGGHDGQPAVFEGYALADVLALYGLKWGKEQRAQVLSTYLLASARDGYRAVFALAEIAPDFTDGMILLADRRNGKPLAADEGPWRLVVPGEKIQARSVRQLQALSWHQIP